jgi:hypothetical protein
MRQVPGPTETLELLKWHLGRNDQRRVSTANRASVVLSAAAILLAGNALILSRLLAGSNATLSAPLAVVFGTGMLASVALVIVSLIRASGVLVTIRASRDTFARAQGLPSALLFNDTDTVSQLATFDDFRAAVDTQDYEAILEAAKVELWIGLLQHRHRYLHLRGAVQALRWAAIAFLVSAAGIVTTVLVNGL